MFAPTKIWRKWHRKINVNQRRYATASALAASAVPALVMARGHRVENVKEIPIVISDEVTAITKTKQALTVLKALGLYDDVEKSKDSKKIRAGKGKARNRRYVLRRGPLVIYEESDGIDKAFRNIPGLEVTRVDSLNLLQLAPGGHVGRLILWTRTAFMKLDSLFGTYSTRSTLKTGYTLPRHIMSNADVSRVINSDEVQSVVRDPILFARPLPMKQNPLRNRAAMLRLNPYFAAVSAREQEIRTKGSEKRLEIVARKREQAKQSRLLRSRKLEFWNNANKEGDVMF
jgi:large subunit ribosomal protein L4e